MPRLCANSTCDTREFVDGRIRPARSEDPRSPGQTRTPCCVGTDFGEGSLTESGYPRLVKRWRRGQPLDEAETVFSGASTDVVAAASVDRTPGFERTMLGRALDFFNDENLRTARRRVDPHRYADRRYRLGASRTGCSSSCAPTGTRAARSTWPARCWPLTTTQFLDRHGATAGGVRTRRAHRPEPLRVDPGQVGAGHARRRGQPRRGRHAGHVGRPNRCRGFRRTPTP